MFVSIEHSIDTVNRNNLESFLMCGCAFLIRIIVYHYLYRTDWLSKRMTYSPIMLFHSRKIKENSIGTNYSL